MSRGKRRAAGDSVPGAPRKKLHHHEMVLEEGWGSGGARRGGREALRGRCGTPPARPSKYNLKMCFGQLREAVRRIPPGGCSTAF